MKLKKLYAVLALLIPTATLATTISCKKKTPNLDALKAYLPTVTLEKLLVDVEIIEGEVKVENIPNGKKAISKTAVTEYEQALTTAKLVTEEGKAQQAKTDLEAAVKKLTDAIVTGTSTKKIDELKYYIASVEIDKILKDVQVTTGDPVAADIPKGTKAVSQAKVDEYKLALDAAKAVVDEDKAEQAKTDLQAAVKKLTDAFIEGTSAKFLEHLKTYIQQVKDEKILENVEEVDTVDKPENISNDKKVVLKSAAAAFKKALADAEAVEKENEAEQAKKTLEQAVKDIKAAIVKGISDKNVQALKDALPSLSLTTYVLDNKITIVPDSTPISDVPGGEKFIYKSVYDAYNQKWNDAKSITKDSVAKAKLAELQQEFENIKTTKIQVGTSTKNLEAYRAYLESIAPAKVIVGVEVRDTPQAPMEFLQGKKQIKKTIYEAYAAYWNAEKAKLDNNEILDKAAKAKQNEVKEEFKKKFTDNVVVGQATQNYLDMKQLLKENDPTKMTDLIVYAHLKIEADEIESGQKGIDKLNYDRYKNDWVETNNNLTSNDYATTDNLNVLKTKISMFKSKIVTGDGTTIGESIKFLKQYTKVDNKGSLEVKTGALEDLNGRPRIAKLLIPKTLDGKEIKKIGYQLFLNVNYIQEVKILADIVEVYGYAFQGHTDNQDLSIKLIKFPRIPIKFGPGVFKYTTLNKIEIPESSTLFSNNKELFASSTINGDLKLPKGWKTLPESCFHTTKIKGNLYLPDQISTTSGAIEINAFESFEITGNIYLVNKDTYTNNKAEFDKAITDLSTKIKIK
ncbi:leucine rich repeat (LRR) protein [Metamycoplasma subdolum]|uniref:Leucine rich repeat (LRR) protein n=1 Tax=Metamycoplasma subdolum TaxID=92407 RepID=A0A3M0A1D9_9BACT|nr:leucine-rich repeat protein [Metamycoplasma subdolum]RMA78971.1 leucine rich repeat (LRR) protein [Metamycoplasma subdolum]WPB50494.1 leucine-rich repeat protein [Metamycoplasma subdolum]